MVLGRFGNWAPCNRGQISEIPRPFRLPPSKGNKEGAKVPRMMVSFYNDSIVIQPFIFASLLDLIEFGPDFTDSIPVGHRVKVSLKILSAGDLSRSREQRYYSIAPINS